MDTSIALTRVPTRQALDRPHQGVLVGAPSRAVAERRARPVQDRAGPPLRDAVGLTQIVCGSTLLGGRHHFFLATSWSIFLSNSNSATSSLRRSTSVSNSRMRRD